MACKLTYRDKRYDSMKELENENMFLSENTNLEDFLLLENKLSKKKFVPEEHNIHTPQQIEKLFDELNSDFANKSGYILDKYVNHVRAQIKGIGGIFLMSSSKGHYLQTGNDNVVDKRQSMTEVLNQLSSKFGIEWRFDTEMSAKGRFEGDVVYINPDKATLDTLFHEFGHPFLIVLKKENPELYKKLLRGIKNEKKILERTKKLYPNLSEEELYEEAIVESLGRKAADISTKQYEGAFDKFIKWIKGIILDLFGYEYTSFRDVAQMLSNKEYKKTLEKTNSKALYQIDENDLNIYLSQLEGKTLEQKQVAERVIIFNRRLKLANDNGTYLTPEGDVYKRTTQELDSYDYYRYEKESNEENKTLALEWGNAVDSIARDALLGKPITPTILDNEIELAIYKEFMKIKEDYPNCIILPQITFINESRKIAGTADIVIIHPTGEIEIMDVKTSRYDFKLKENNFKGKQKADSYDRHNAQLTMYRALAESMGYEFVKKEGLTVVPIKLDVSEENKLVGWSRPVPYIKHKGVKMLYEKYNMFFKKDQFENVISNLKKIIQKKINKARSEGKVSQERVLNDILTSISSAINIEAVNQFIEEAYSTFIGTENFEGYYKILKKNIENLQFQEDPMENLSKIHEIHDSMKLYKDAISEIWKSYIDFNNLNPLDDFEKGSTLDKLDKVMKAFDAMENDFKDNIPKTIATVLAKQVNPTIIESIKQNIKQKRKQVKEFVKKDTSKMSFFQKQKYLFKQRQIEAIKKKLNELEEQFLNDDGNIDMEQVILREIKMGGYNDVSMIDRMLSPAISMPNSFLPTFILTIKKAFEEVRIKNLQFIPKAYKQFQEFAKAVGGSIDNPSILNKGLFKTTTVYNSNGEEKRILTFVSPIDYSKFNIEEQKFKKSLENTEKDSIFKKRLQWEAKNTQLRPTEHIEGVTKIGNTVLIETIPELEKRKLKELGRPAFEKWKADNTFNGILRKEYRIPNLKQYADEEFIKMNNAQKKYYTFLISTYFESQSKLPKRKEADRFILPYIDKSSNDRLREGNYWDTLKYKAKDTFMLMEEDIMKENVEKNKVIPVLYYNNMLNMNAEDVSTDLIHSVLRFKMAADRYSVQNKYVPLADNLLTLVKGTQPSEQDSEGFKILDKAAKAVGIEKGVSKYVQKHGENNIVSMLEAFIDTQIYGINRKDFRIKIGGITIDTGKIADTIMNFSSLTQIAVDPLTSLANSLNAQIQIAEEAFAGQFISMKTWKNAQKYYSENEMELIRDSLEPYNKSFLGTLSDTYDAMQGEYVDEYGHKLSKSAFKAKMNTGLLYAGMHKGEHRAANVMMISLLMETKVGDKTLFEIHKEQFEKTGKIELDFNTQSRLHAINKRLNGVYNKFDLVEAQRYATGRLLLMYRKFLVPGLKRRFKNEGIDYELGDFTEGMYRTFYKKLFFETNELYKVLFNKESKMTSYERYNVRRALFEHLMIAVTGILAYILMNIAKGFDDDDEKYIFNALLYEVLRVNSELSVYGGIGDINNYMLPDWDEFTSPYSSTSAVFNTISKVSKLYSFAMGDIVNIINGEDIERYKAESGIFQKGDSKTMAALLKLMGMSGKNLDTETAIEILALTKGIKIDK